MNIQAKRTCGALLILTTAMLTACATVRNSVVAPDVSLRSVQLTDLSFGKQTFVLGFAASNSNPFPLPVKSVSYGVVLDGHTFASGASQNTFSIPASGDGEFYISVELNLLRTAPHLLSVVRDGKSRSIPYEVEGSLGIDIPYTRPISFKSDGSVRLQSGALKFSANPP